MGMTRFHSPVIVVIGDATTVADELAIELFIALTASSVIADWAVITSDSALIKGFVMRLARCSRR